MSEESKLKLNDEGKAAIEATANGTLKEETFIAAAKEEPPVKRAKKLPARKPIKVEEAVPPFELPEAKIVIEESNVEVSKIKVDAENAKVDAENAKVDAKNAPAPKAAKQVTPTDFKRMVKQLRASDKADEKTCAACLRRVPLSQISGGFNEVCNSCK